MRGSLPEQNAYKQDDGGASGADHDCFDALDPQDGFLPPLGADCLMRVDLGLNGCGGGLAHVAYGLSPSTLVSQAALSFAIVSASVIAFAAGASRKAVLALTAAVLADASSASRAFM